MPFDDDDKQPRKKIGLNDSKLPASNVKTSTIKENYERKKYFDQKIEDFVERKESLDSQIGELALAYKKILLDSTLEKNKNQLDASLEKDVLSKLILVANAMNEDESMPEGMGSMALCTIMLKCMIHQRNKINELSYQLSTLAKNDKI